MITSTSKLIDDTHGTKRIVFMETTVRVVGIPVYVTKRFIGTYEDMFVRLYQQGQPNEND